MVRGYPRPEIEFWTEAIGQVRQHHPDFLFLAEAYWGLEHKLQLLGFDFTYDKPFYDRLLSSTPTDIRNYLMSNTPYQERSVRFIENHDEPRAVTTFGRERSLAAAVILATVPGLRLFHDGQLEGKRIKLPIQLVSEPTETPDAEVALFYERLLKVVNQPAFHNGEWALISEGNHNLLAWFWRYVKQIKVVVVNYSASPGQGWLRLPAHLKTYGEITLHDELTGVTYSQNAGEINRQGLYVNLAPYHAQILAVGSGES